MESFLNARCLPLIKDNTYVINSIDAMHLAFIGTNRIVYTNVQKSLGMKMRATYVNLVFIVVGFNVHCISKLKLERINVQGRAT